MKFYSEHIRRLKIYQRGDTWRMLITFKDVGSET